MKCKTLNSAVFLFLIIFVGRIFVIIGNFVHFSYISQNGKRPRKSKASFLYTVRAGYRIFENVYFWSCKGEYYKEQGNNG